MAGSTGSGSRRWVVFLVVAIALLFFSKYLLIGAQAVLGVLLPGSTPLVSQPEKVAAPEPTAHLEATMALEPTRAQEVVVETGPVTITIWHRWIDTQLTTYRSIFDDYSRSHPNVTIELVQQQDIPKILPTVLAAGEGPDLVIDSSSYIAQYTPDLLLPLDEYGVDWSFMSSNFRDSVIGTVISPEHIWGLPIVQFGMALIVNKDLVNVQDDFTYDVTTFINFAQAYEQAHPGKKFICNPGFAYKDPYFLAPIVFSGGNFGGFVDMEGNVHLNHPETIRGAEYLPQFRDISLPNSDYVMCETAFLNGEAAIWWNGPWVIHQLNANGIDYETRGLGKPYMNSDAVLLPVSAKTRGHVGTALDVAKYLISSPVQTRLAIELEVVPTSWPTLENATEIPEGIRSFAVALEEGIPLFSNRFIDAQWTPVQEALTRIVDGDQSAEEALNEAQRILEEQIGAMK